MNVITIKNELLQSATYFIGDYLVDCGGSDRIFESLEGRELNGIFLTHCHQDHAVSFTHFRAPETDSHLVCRLFLVKKKKTKTVEECGCTVVNR